MVSCKSHEIREVEYWRLEEEVGLVCDGGMGVPCRLCLYRLKVVNFLTHILGRIANLALCDKNRKNEKPAHNFINLFNFVYVVRLWFFGSDLTGT